MSKPIAALILAAGRGERMNSDLPKVLHPAAGVPIVAHVIDAVRGAGVERIAVVVGAQNGLLRSFLNGTEMVVQKKRLGTGHAVTQAEKQFRNWNGDLLILPADAPCIRTETLRGGFSPRL